MMLRTCKTALSIGVSAALAWFAQGARAQIVIIERQDVLSYEWGQPPQALAACGDVNGDGVGDVVMGVRDDRHPISGSSTGGAYVYSGRDGSVLYRIHSPRPTSGGYFGHAVASIRDLNGDGRPDIIIGAYFLERGAYVFSGADGSLIFELTPSDGVRPQAYGIGVSAVPDIDGDGLDDVLVGSKPHVYVFSGATGLELHRASHPYPPPNTSALLDVVAGVPDLDGDGCGDIVVASPGELGPDYVGRVFVFSGRDGSFIRWHDQPTPGYSGVWALTVAGLPDLDGDGMGDYLVNAPRQQVDCNCCYPYPNPCRYNGTVYIYSGGTGAMMGTLTGGLGPTFAFSVSVAVAPDVTGGGKPDIIVGSPEETPPGYPRQAGGAYLFAGENLQLVRSYYSPNPYVPPNEGQGGSDFGRQVAVLSPGRAAYGGSRGDCPDNCPPSRRGRGYIFLSCPADFNYDGILDSRDFFDFVLAFFDGRASADYDRDGRVTSADFFAFINDFFAGCDT